MQNSKNYRDIGCLSTTEHLLIILLRSTHTRGLAPATSPCNKSPEEFTRRDWSQGLVPQTVPVKSLHKGTGRRDLSHKQFLWRILRNISRRDLSQKFKLVWIRGTCCTGTKVWFLWPDFEAKNGQFTRWDLSQRL